jgi:hypothetical protein
MNEEEAKKIIKMINYENSDFNSDRIEQETFIKLLKK